MSISNAHIEFNENGTPIATEFGDIYFSDAKGLEETEYVFLQHNQLPQRWQHHSESRFTIAETGFGTGLNFLVTLLHFDLLIQQQPTLDLNLHFISIEKFPIALDDLKKALSAYPQLNVYIEPLLSQYPIPIQGCHRLHFLQHRVTLDLWLGDVQQVLPQWENPPKGMIDAWYLDGFAPSKNPDMWSQCLFEHMARLAKNHCTFATFTAVGDVRRGLIEAGFCVQKCKGHGRKRNMLAGQIEKPHDNPARAPYFVRHADKLPTHGSPSIAIIGGGLAGANCAYALAKKGLNATLYCQESTLAQGASGNAQGGFYPQLNAEAGVASQIQATAFSYASRLYRQLLADGYNYSHDWCGTLLLAFNQNLQTRYQKMSGNGTWPASLIYPVNPEQASKLANIDIPYSGLFVPQAGWINPPELVEALVKASQCQVKTEHQLLSTKRVDQQWQLNWQDGSQTNADIVIFATGSDSVNIPDLTELPFRLVRGQVEAIPSSGELAKLATVICHKGYLTPAWQGRHALGSTYVKQDTSCEYRANEQETNLQTHQQAISDCSWIHQIQPDQTGRAAIRCSTPDHLPMAGALPNVSAQKSQYSELYKALPASKYPTPINHPNMFLLSGLGSRGLSTAPLCAEILASQITNQTLPLANQLLDALNPNRFLVRALIRRQV